MALLHAEAQGLGLSLTRKGPRYKLRSVNELKQEVESFAGSPAKFDHYFKDTSGGRLKTLVAESKGIVDELSKRLGILRRCQKANKLTDYLPKGADYKNGGNSEGYTNLCANLSVGPSAPKMAPIALDIFPAGHVFHRRVFKQTKRIWGFVYEVPKTSVPAALIGRVEWYYGFCDIKGSDPKKKQRRYGWVPALALVYIGP
jgi:hypothetical protein